MVTRKQTIAAIAPLFFLIISVAPPRARAADENAPGAWGHLEGIWRDGGWEIYVPAYTLHMPYAYSSRLLRSYNDFPAGGGLGLGHYNASGNWEGLYAMDFEDSHDRPEYLGGYAWIATWHPLSPGIRLGAGVAGFLTARSDILGYTPFPGAAPLASIGYGSLDIQTSYIPGGKDFGNIMFFWAKLSFY